MGTLKTTLKVESTDLFPTPVSFTKVNNNIVNGTFSGFNNAIITNTAANLNIAAIGVTGSYVYLENVATSGTAVYLNVGTVVVSSAVIKLAPGDVAFLPVGDSAGGVAAFSAITSGGTASLNYFIGDKG